MLENLTVIHGEPTNERTQKVGETIQSWGLPGMKAIPLRGEQLKEGRRGVVHFYSQVEEEMSLRAMPNKRTSNAIVIVNDAEEFFKILPGHYRILFMSMVASSIAFPELKVRFIFTMNYKGEQKDNDSILRELML